MASAVTKIAGQVSTIKKNRKNHLNMIMKNLFLFYIGDQEECYTIC